MDDIIKIQEQYMRAYKMLSISLIGFLWPTTRELRAHPDPGPGPKF